MQITSAAYFLPAVLPICAWVAWSDLARMKIPNKAVIALAVAFLVIGPFALKFNYSDYGLRIVAGVAMFFVGWLLTILRTMGAGDAKFIAAAAPFIANPQIPAHAQPQTLFVVLVLFTILLLLTFVLHRLFRIIPPIRNLTPNWASWTSKKFPMGVPLALTLAIFVTLTSVRMHM